MSFLLHDPIWRPLGANGGILPGCYLQFFVSGTTTPTDVYADAALGTSLGDVVTADSAGVLVAIYGDSAVVYRRQLYDADHTLLLDVDPLHPTADYPAGTIVMFDGDVTARDAAYPSALWDVCDGSNGTKDSRDSSPVGVSDTKPITGAGSTGGTGGTVTSTAAGAHDHGAATGSYTLLAADIPAHRHFTATESGSSNDSTITSTTTTDANTPYGGDSQYRLRQRSATADAGLTSSTGGGGGHSHSITAATDHTHDVDIGQGPYFTVWFLKRKS